MKYAVLNNEKIRKAGGVKMEYAVLNNGIKIPMAGIGTFLLTPDEAEASVLHALDIVSSTRRMPM